MLFIHDVPVDRDDERVERFRWRYAAQKARRRDNMVPAMAKRLWNPNHHL